MQSFLRHTAQKVLSEYEALDQLVMVFPNRRAGLFFTKHLGSLIDRPQWMPEVKTIEDIFYSHAGMKPADQLTLIFELYKIYAKLAPKPETFDRFYYWGEIILKDFNDLDQFLVDASRLYHQLEEVKSMEADLTYLTQHQVKLIQEFWKSFEVRDREHQEKFLKFWKLLWPLYKNFKEALIAPELSYSGALYRKVVEELDHLKKPAKHHVFVGFNAFTKAEERLVKHYVKEFGADILWDLDPYYLDDHRQEAGAFFREYRKDKVLGPTFPQDPEKRIGNSKINIRVHAIPLKVNQANLVGKLLEKIKPGEALEETAVILPEEQMLFPVLHALPDSIAKVNVTMGYPVTNSPIYGFLESLLELQKHVGLKQGQVEFYHKPVNSMLRSPYFKAVNGRFVMRLLKVMEETNLVYIPAATLAAGGDFFGIVFKKVDSSALFSYLMEVIRYLATQQDLPELQQSYIYQCYKQLTRLNSIFQSEDTLQPGLEFLSRLFKQVFREVKLPFEGEPLEGVQVMGVLETRNLDFKRLIICNMNEGNFPPSAAMDSLVPYNLRRAFGLPVQEQNDAIYAYTFLRLLQSAEEVDLIYTTEAEEGKVGEKSRYIQQLALESPLDVKEQTVFVPLDVHPSEPIVIYKTGKVLEILSRYEVGKGGERQTRLSPSAINLWLDCRLKFYFRYVVGIREREEVQEKIDPAVFGNLAHYSLEFLYQGFQTRKRKSVLEKADFADLKEKWVAPSVALAIQKHYSLPEGERAQLSGQLIIARDVLQRYLVRLLEVDEAYAPFEIISLEASRNYFSDLTLNLPQGDKVIGIKGIIDRVDRKGDTIRLIDYKSGADKKDFTDIPSLFDRENKSRNKAAMQTLMYGLLFHDSMENAGSLRLKPAVFNLKEIFNQGFSPYLMMGPPRQPKEEIEDFLNYELLFREALRDCVTEIFHPEIPFDQTTDLSKCFNCAFNAICSRV